MLTDSGKYKKGLKDMQRTIHKWEFEKFTTSIFAHHDLDLTSLELLHVIESSTFYNIIKYLWQVIVWHYFLPCCVTSTVYLINFYHQDLKFVLDVSSALRQTNNIWLTRRDRDRYWPIRSSLDWLLFFRKKQPNEGKKSFFYFSLQKFADNSSL